MPIHIKGSGGGKDKSKGLTATKYDIRYPKTALVNGEIVTGDAIIQVIAHPNDDTEGSDYASRTMTFSRASGFKSGLQSVSFLRISGDENWEHHNPKLVKSKTVFWFTNMFDDGVAIGETVERTVVAAYFASTSSTSLTLDELEVEFSLNETELTIKLPSGYYFEGEQLEVTALYDYN